MATDPKLQPGNVRAVEQTAAAPANLLDEILENGRLAQTSEEKLQSTRWLQDFVGEILAGEIVVSKDTEKMLDQRISQLDQVISKQLNQVIHAPEFQKLEETWRGLHYLVQNSETSTMLKIKVLNINQKDLLKDLRKAAEFDQSKTFKMIHDEGYGVLGGEPYGVLIGDYEVTRHPDDLELIEKMSNVAAACHAPFLAAASPKLLNWGSYAELNKPRDLAKIFESDAYIRWQSFRKSEDAKYVGLTLPHVLLRLPYGEETAPVEEFQFEEHVKGTDHSKYLWGNAAYAFGTRLASSFAETGWCARIRGVEGGGLVEGLPLHTFVAEDGDYTAKCPTEVAIPDRREKEFSDLGFIALCHYKGTDNAAFPGASSCHRPAKYRSDAANANARLAVNLPYTFAVCRFAHYLKAMMRDKVGSFMSREECERFLNDWISTYVLLDDTAGPEAKARCPLREARIEVKDLPGKPGSYSAVAFLRPHYQLEELTVSLRLVAEIPKPGGK